MTRHTLLAALAVEAQKAKAARVVVGTTVLLIAGVTILSAVTTEAARSGNAQILAKLGPIAAQGGWTGLLNGVNQITAAAGLLAFGVVLSWMFGREFTEGTITGLFGLPVTRPTIALAKLVIYLLWTVVVAVLLTTATATVGAAFGLGLPDSAAWVGLARLLGLTLMTATLAIPAAWAASLGRGLLPGIATTIGLIAVAQIMVVAGTGGWFPFAAPALWSIMPATVTGAQLTLVAVVPIAFGVLTLSTWRGLQLDR